MTTLKQSLPPTEEKLRLLVLNKMESVAQGMIDAHKMPYRIVNGELKDSLEGSDLWLSKFITKDPDMIAVKDDVIKLAKIDDEVLITGESGTGKELIARALIGNRKGQVIAVNCSGIPDTLVESSLFGYVKGAFTGADNQRQGLCANASDGILFLDEIGELPMSVQAKLLRAIQEKVITRVGGKDEEKISCRFVCATHRNIKKMVEEDKFRLDLYARISTFELHLKPLRDRKCDVEPIINNMKGGPAFLEALATNKRTIGDLDLRLNVRSLEQYVKRYSGLSRIII